MAKVLSKEQLTETLKKPKHEKLLKRACNNESKVRFYTESNLDLAMLNSRQANEFLAWVKGLIPLDKYQIFLQLFRLPTPSVALTDKAFKPLKRVFDGRNPTREYTFTDSLADDDWEYYRTDVLKDETVWAEQGWEKLKTAFNSVVVIDLPAVPNSERPEPYFYWVDIDDVIDFSSPDGTAIDWIVFEPETEDEDGIERVAVIDGENYYLYQVLEGERTGDKVVVLERQSPHGLGYCPAQFFWDDSLTSREADKGLKKNPIVKHLSAFEWHLFYATSKKHLDLYASYPIYSGYEVDCDYNDTVSGDTCDGGFIRRTDGDYRFDVLTGGLEKCPKCSAKRLAGVGSFIEIPIPNVEQGVPDMRNPVQITSIDRGSLDYNVEELERLESNLIADIVGHHVEMNEKVAANEIQISSNFEARKAPLLELKANFEKIIKFVHDTVCRLRYGEVFLNSYINMGTEFYILTVSELYAKAKMAKDNGASAAELSAINDQILETENRNNPVQFQRLSILKHLEPYPHLTLPEIIQLKGQNLLLEDLLIIKINFTTFIERFERENTNITEFGLNLDFAQRVNVIFSELRSYAKEYIPPALPQVVSAV